MKKGLSELVFIIDCSGSMGGLESDTVGGFNSMLKKQKKASGEAYVSTVFFNHTSRVIHDRKEIGEVPELTEDDYECGGATALLDAVGNSVNHIRLIHRYARPEDVPENTLFVIITDGMENSSETYNYTEVKRLLSEVQEKYNWEFLFLGANIDAAKEASDIGIDTDHAVEFRCDHEGTALNYECICEAVSSIRSSDKTLKPDWKRSIEKDYKERKNTK